MRLGWRTSDAKIQRQERFPIQETTCTLASRQDDPGSALLQQDRSALLLRPVVAAELDADLLAEARSQFSNTTCVVPVGQVKVDRWQFDCSPSGSDRFRSDIADVEAFYLRRCVVTNLAFQSFVDHGGYHQAALWHDSVWPRVAEFVDQTGKAGPRYWSDGHHDESKSAHPVVGVSWFEADAYARWIGMRLPTDAEWVRAACAPIASSDSLIQRKYPWGDSFRPDRANLREGDHNALEAANALPDSDSAFGLRQMIGNVWEWTASCVELWRGDEVIDAGKPLRSLRGGAFDSYLGTEATCQCRSADSPMKRSHNIGFRCAVSAFDLICLDPPQPHSMVAPLL